MDEENVIEMMGERWKKIRGYEDLYLISESGKVYSIRKKKVMKPQKYAVSKNSQFHYDVVLYDKNGKNKTHQIHRLVLIHFVSGPPFDGAVCRHIDNDTTNNHYTNLQWGSIRDNVYDRLDNDRDPQIYITRQNVIDIKNDLLRGMKYIEISEKYNTSVEIIKNISANSSWKDIGPDMSKFNYREKQHELLIYKDAGKIGIDKTAEENIEYLQNMIDDYIKNGRKFVINKYNISENRLKYLLKVNNIQRRKLLRPSTDEINMMKEDYFNNDINFLVKKYNMTIGRIQWLFKVNGIHKGRKNQKSKNTQRSDGQK